jgi:nitronate monooxygenase
MAGADTPALVAAVSNAGGLGSLGAARTSPDGIRKAVAEIHALTRRPFGLNLFVLEPSQPHPAQLSRALELLQPVRNELALPPATAPANYCDDFSAQFDALLEAKPVVASFTFGILDQARISALKARGILVMGTATNVAEARAWESVGADMICAQGSEAGAHRGTFLGDFESSLIGTMALIPQVADAVRVPVVAAGGIMDGRGIAASLILGAAGVQLGTAFLTCPEAGVSPAWKNALLNAREDQTRVTRAFSGRPARGIINDFMERFRELEQEFPPYPVQNALTTPIRQAAAKANRPEFLSLWAGQGVRLSRSLPAAALVAALVQETTAVLNFVPNSNAAR